jgi:large subunit ribosomal protein L22
MVKAELKNYRQSSRKVRLVADLVRGKKVNDALDLLTFTIKRASDPIKKLIESAIANAEHNFNLNKDNLFISEIRVDEGPTLKRHRPRAHGRAFMIRKRTSRVLISLDEIEKGKATAKTEDKAESKKDAPKNEKTAKTTKKTADKKVESKKDSPKADKKEDNKDNK